MQDFLNHMATTANKHKDKKGKEYQEEMKSHAEHIIKSIDDKEVIKLFMEKVENLTNAYNLSKDYRRECIFGVRPEVYWKQQNELYTG